jgi:hypothetical protein
LYHSHHRLFFTISHASAFLLSAVIHRYAGMHHRFSFTSVDSMPGQIGQLFRRLLGRKGEPLKKLPS